VSLRWDVELYASTLVAPGAVFDKLEDDGYVYENHLLVTGADLTEILCQNAHGTWPEDAFVETEQVLLGRFFADGVARIGNVTRELVHGVKLRFVLVADGMLPAEVWGSWRLRYFDKARDA
jgi:hypothetical protein